MKRLTHSQSVTLMFRSFATLVCLTTLGLAAIPASVSADSNDTTRSTNIALNRSGSLLFNVNVDANSVTAFSVSGDKLKKLDEVPVGREPFCVAVEDGRAFANPIEIRGQGAPGLTPFGARGFNVPSLLSVNYHAPYFHNGQATTLEDVFDQHVLNGGTIADALGDADEANLLAFLRSIDGRTATFESDGDLFKDPTPTRTIP